MSSSHERLDRLTARLDALENEQRRTIRTLAVLIADVATIQDATAIPPTPDERPETYYEIEYRLDRDSLWSVSTDPTSPYTSAEGAAERIAELSPSLPGTQFRIVKVIREIVS